MTRSNVFNTEKGNIYIIYCLLKLVN